MQIPNICTFLSASIPLNCFSSAPDPVQTGRSWKHTVAAAALKTFHNLQHPCTLENMSRLRRSSFAHHSTPPLLHNRKRSFLNWPNAGSQWATRQQDEKLAAVTSEQGYNYTVMTHESYLRHESRDNSQTLNLSLTGWVHQRDDPSASQKWVQSISIALCWQAASRKQTSSLS